MKNLFSKIIPSNFTNLFGLAKKLVRSKNPAGRAAMFYSLLGLLMIPVDLVLQLFEKKLYRKGYEPQLPLIFVCGPPRGGTTIVAQVLIKHLPVYYFNNLTSIFPNSPIISNKIAKRFLKKDNHSISFKSLYGRTNKLYEPNDALYIWDRWTKVNRESIPHAISNEDKLKMKHFFGAVERFSGLPLVNKNNKLNTFADKVSEILDTAYFICLDRDPVYLAQSELIASRFIHDNDKIPYGVSFNTDDEYNRKSLDPVEQVCNQVLRHKEVMLQQEKLIGKERFIIVRYEEFCAEPAKWVCKISDKILGHGLNLETLTKDLPPFQLSNNMKLNQEEFNRIENFFKK